MEVMGLQDVVEHLYAILLIVVSMRFEDTLTASKPLREL